MEEEKKQENQNIEEKPEEQIVSETPDLTEEPEVKEVPETAEVSDKPEEQENPESPETQEKAETTDNPEEKKEAEAQENPEEQEASETAENPEDPEKQESRKKRKRPGKRKLKQFIFVGLLAIAALMCLMIALHLLDVDNRFVRAVNAGMSESWALENNEIQLKDSEAPNDTSFIDIEYNEVKSFKGKKFKNKSLGSLAEKYIAALEGCRTAIEENDPDKDFDKFWGAFSQSYGQRVEAIYDLYNGDYGIELDEVGAAEELDDLKLSAWSLKKTADIKFTRVKAEEKKDENEAGSESEAEAESDSDSGLETVLQATVTNDSGFDLEYINIEVELYDEKGGLIETATAYADNIKNKDEFKLRIYQLEETKADAYKITSVQCHRKDEAKPKAESKEEALLSLLKSA